MSDISMAYKSLNKYKYILTRQELKTLAGQIKSGNIDAAQKGLETIMRRKGDQNGTETARSPTN